MNESNRTKRAEVRMRKKVVADILDSVPEYIQKVQCDTTSWTRPFKCAVISCRNVFHKHDPHARQKFHNFPNDPTLQTIWLSKCRVNDGFNVNSAKVCTDHFLPDDYERNFKQEITNPLFKRTLKPTAVPTQLLEGIEVTIVDFLSSAQGGVCEVPDIAQVKSVVDENMFLKEKHAKLVEEKEKLLAQKADFLKKLHVKNRKFRLVRSNYHKLNEKKSFILEQKNLLTKVFSLTQINVLLGKQRVVWTHDDMAMAFTLRHMGNRELYLYMKNVLNVPLPSLRSVQIWAASK